MRRLVVQKQSRWPTKVLVLKDVQIVPAVSSGSVSSGPTACYWPVSVHSTDGTARAGLSGWTQTFLIGVSRSNVVTVLQSSQNRSAR